MVSPSELCAKIPKRSAIDASWASDFTFIFSRIPLTMRLDGTFRRSQLMRDLLILLAAHNKLKDLALTRRHLIVVSAQRLQFLPLRQLPIVEQVGSL